LQQPAEVFADLLFHMAVPPIGGESEAGLLPVHGDVKGRLQPDDVLPGMRLFRESPSGGVLEQVEAQFRAGQAEGMEVFDLSLNRSEVTHGVSFRVYENALTRGHADQGALGGFWFWFGSWLGLGHYLDVSHTKKTRLFEYSGSFKRAGYHHAFNGTDIGWFYVFRGYPTVNFKDTRCSILVYGSFLEHRVSSIKYRASFLKFLICIY
jgi:hypothetical protein